MATFDKGILGGFSGKVGPVVGAQVNGQNILRSAPKKITRPPSEAQRLQRLKMKVVGDFLNPMAFLLTTSFGKPQGKKSSFNLATSYHLTDALIPTADGFSIQYPKVLIARGDLRGLDGTRLTVESNQTLQLQWDNNSNQAMANATDRLLLVLYVPELKAYEFYTNVATREEALALVSYPINWQGKEAHCWETFRSSTGVRNAVSSYLETILL